MNSLDKRNWSLQVFITLIQVIVRGYNNNYCNKLLVDYIIISCYAMPQYRCKRVFYISTGKV